MKRLFILTLALGLVSLAGVNVNAQEVELQKTIGTSRTSWHESYYGDGVKTGSAYYCDSTGYTPMYAENSGSGYEYIEVDPDVYGTKSDTDHNGHAYVSHHMNYSAKIKWAN